MSTEPLPGTLRIGVVGAGAIGGYVAAELTAGGAQVTLLGRSERSELLRALRLDGRPVAGAHEHRVSADYAALAGVDACVVAVKSTDTEAVATALAQHLKPDVSVVSLQNGLHAARTLRRHLGERVAGGVVVYNVMTLPDGTRRQATRGKVFIERLAGARAASVDAVADALARGGEDVEISDHIEDVQRGKLLLNLNNGVCAATGLGIAASLENEDARACYAACILEGIATLRACRLSYARVAALPAGAIARAMALPNWLLGPMAKKLAGVAEAARSSTLQDLDRGRRTEIRELNGAIVELAERAGRTAPANDVITRAVLEHEHDVTHGRPAAFVTPSALRARIEAARRGAS
ncbi:MAG: 2-dehydropantoate 2-reductase [Polyangiaceae bacterium]|nr:2-dehydropantoate 2-reductase [Polyangiaceae bacterium]